MRGFVLGIFVTLFAIAVGAFAVSYFGLYPIGADNPPGSIERALGIRALVEYADKHKPSGDNPVQPTPENLLAGATEYEEHCAFCHGGAKAKISPMRDKLNPPAPQLLDGIPDDDDAWLFWVSKHGVRMTGMPTWDGIMSDEVLWKIIAFLKHSDQLPPDVQSAWEKLAATPGEIEEHTPEQHERTPATEPARRR